MVEKYNKACTEILEILKYLPKHEYEKIPKEEIEFFEQNKDKSYVFEFNEELSFEEQSILPETQTIIVKLYKDYFWLNDSKLYNDSELHINNDLEQCEQEDEKNEEIFENKLKNSTMLVSNDDEKQTLRIQGKKWYTILIDIFKRK